jgi:hypothetical protein
VLVTAAVTVVIVVHESSGPSVSTSTDVAVTANQGATVRLAGATLVIPPGALSANGTVVARVSDSKARSGLSANGKPETSKPLISSAGQTVSFELSGARVVRPLTLTLPVSSAALAQAKIGANQRNAVWLAYYDEADQSWSPVPSEYNPATQTVTAEVSHLSTWNPFTWDWSAITLRMRQALTAFGSGRAPKTTCPGTAGSTVTMDGGSDPPLIGCVTGDAASGFQVSITNNRAYTMVLQAPRGVVQQPRPYTGFEEYVQSRDLVTKALGGAYLAPVSTVTYSLPQNGNFAFSSAASYKTSVLDLGTTVAETIFDVVTAGYAKCILDNAANSGPAPLSEAPSLISECLPIENVILELAEDLSSLQNHVVNILATIDWVADMALNIHGGVHVSLPIDWRNTSYATTCGGAAQQPFTVTVRGGQATYALSSQSAYDIRVTAITEGRLLGGASDVTAVLLTCTPTPSNYFTTEIHVFTADNRPLTTVQQPPDLIPGGYTPYFSGDPFLISNGLLTTGADYYPSCHACGVVPYLLTWELNENNLVLHKATSLGAQSSQPTAAACPNSAQLLAAWNSAPAALRNSWVGVQVTGFTTISCWNGWIVAIPVSPSPGNGEVVFSQIGNLHLITTAELHQQFAQEVCSSPNAPPGWKEPPLISCS